MPKFRYEYPPHEARYLEAPSGRAALEFLRRTYPHNLPAVASTLVEIPHWPPFWRIVDDDGRELTAKSARAVRDRASLPEPDEPEPAG